jgi:transposase InsO family protein
MTQKILFIADCARELDSVSEVCRRYGVSRKTGYKWIERFKERGLEGLAERTRRPLHFARSTPTEIIDRILKARGRHPDWGAKKLLWLLDQQDPEIHWPPRSTVCDILKRNGLVPPQRRRRKPSHPGRPTTPMTTPNEIWTADFKGKFKTGNGVYCYPLTVEDGFSRYLLDIQSFLSPSHQLTQPAFERLFREYGLPKIIRTDNGAPFATTAIGRLSRLSVWWIRLGIFPELIEPGHPEQNPRHERMHKTLKHDTTRPPSEDHHAQQKRFDTFRHYYNHERPHESLGQRTPASVYQPSERSFPKRLPKIEYPGHFELRRVSRNGGIRWHSKWVCVSHVLAEEYVGFEEIDDGLWEVFYGPVRLGRFNERISKIEDDQGRKYRKNVLPMSPD